MRRSNRTSVRNHHACCTADDILTRVIRATAEALERRLLLAFANVPVNDPTTDTASFFNGNTQSESATLAFRTSPTAQPIVLTAFNDTRYLIDDQGTGWARSTDGGRSFIDQGAFPELNSAGSDLFDPVLARNSNNSYIYYAAISPVLDTNQKVAVFRSIDDGESFEPPTIAFNSTSVNMDKEWIAVDNSTASGTGQGYVYIAAWDRAADMIRVARSTDHGQNWSEVVAFDGSDASIPGENNARVQGASIVVGADHSVHVFWLDSDPGTSPNPPLTRTIRMSTGTHGSGGSMSFSTPVTVATINSVQSSGDNGDLGLGFKSNTFPMAVAHPTDANKVYVVYADKPNNGTLDRADIFMKVSAQGTSGLDWSAAATRVNQDNTTNDQFSPSLAIKPDGSQLFVGWHDRRNDPANYSIETFGRIANVISGTPTFQNDFKISSEPFVPYYNIEAGIKGTYMGDYDQSSALDDGFYYSWGDNRDATPGKADDNQGPNVYFQRIPSISGSNSTASQDRDTITVEIDPNDNTKVRVRSGSSTIKYFDTLAGAPTIIIDALAGADTVTSSVGTDLVVYGGSGIDTIEATATGASGNDTFYGGSGDDFLYGGPGDDSIDGGSGADEMDGGGHGMDGDTISYATRSEGFDVDVSSSSELQDGDAFSAFENITGSLGADVLTGTDSLGVSDGQNILDGGEGGQDTISAGSGDDTIRIYGHATISSTNVNAGADNDVVYYLDSVKTAVGAYIHETVNSTTAQVTLSGNPVVRYTGAETFSFSTFSGGNSMEIDSALTNTNLVLHGGSGQDTIEITDPNGTAAVTVDGGDGLDQLNVNSDAVGTAKVFFEKSQRLGGMHIYNGGTVTMAAGGEKTLLVYDGSTGNNAEVEIDAGATLDLNQASMIVYGTMTGPNNVGVRSLINSGRNGGAWDGAGIISTAAKNQTDDVTTLGFMSGNEFKNINPNTNGADAVFDGVRILRVLETSPILHNGAPPNVLVQYTYYGDADFNGTVNFDDYSRIDAGFTNSRTGWLNGDFDLNNAVNFDDYSLIDRAFYKQGEVLYNGGPGGGDPRLIAIGQMPHFTQAYMWHFINWNIDNHGIYYTPEDFFPDGEPW